MARQGVAVMASWGYVAHSLNGPFPDPLTKPMQNSLRVIPEHNSDISTSEVCASCHSIHLPVLDREQPESQCLPQTDPPDPFRCFAASRTLRAEVVIDNLVGHRFPSGVGFRRAFVEFQVLDAKWKVLWASGRSNDQGVLIDSVGLPLAGEFWWKADCSARLPNAWQPHFEEITRQDQAQIYQEMITNAQGQLTTSFLSINGHPKDNRLQPHGFLPEAERIAIAAAFGDCTPVVHGPGFPMDQNLAVAVSPEGEAARDPDYQNGSGKDRLRYVVKGLAAKPAVVTAQMYHQAIPSFCKQDRYCTATKADGTPVTDTERLRYLAGHLDLGGTAAEGWKLRVGGSREVGL